MPVGVKKFLWENSMWAMGKVTFFLPQRSDDFAFVARVSQCNFFLHDNKIEIPIKTFPNDVNESSLCEGPLNGMEGITYFFI